MKNFYMPAEFSPHYGTILIRPERIGSWGKDPSAALRAFAAIADVLSAHEKVFYISGPASLSKAKSEVCHDVDLFAAETNDSWARDIAPVFVTDGCNIKGLCFGFNAWGGSFDGLYTDYDKDAAFAAAFCRENGFTYGTAYDFILEGGSICCDGEGTLITTEECLLSQGRNPALSKAEIENKLKHYFAAEKVLWLPYGIYNDETNGHVDNICTFISPSEVVLAWTDDTSDPQYDRSLRDLEYLSSVTDARDRKIKIHKLPVPDIPVCFSENDCENILAEEGEDVRVPGERLAASYVNFYFANDIILFPAFGGENISSDIRAQKIIGSLCPDRELVTVDASAIIKGGGNIHCITQQIPRKAGT